MIIPFYLGGKDRIRVAVIGGGYAGFAAIAAVREYRKDAEITLIDPRESQLKITHLQTIFCRKSNKLSVSFTDLASRFRFRHVCKGLKIDNETMRKWNAERIINVGDEQIPFDYLIVAAGSPSKFAESMSNTFTLDDFINHPSIDVFRNTLQQQNHSGAVINIIGAGPTGIQFIFEIQNFVRRISPSPSLRLIDSGAYPLHQFNPKIGQYVRSRLEQLGIEYLPNHVFLSQEGDIAILEDLESSEFKELPSSLSLIFTGKERVARYDANMFGQVMVNGETLEHVFVAGDCGRFSGLGSNTMTAQSAVRKGRLVARNILRMCGHIKLLEPYLHQDMGYVVSLGRSDAIGWIGMERNVVYGPAACMAKEMVDGQYNMLLKGFDTYLI